MELKDNFRSTEIGVLPNDWNVIQLQNITTKIGSGITPTGGTNVYKEEGRPFVRSQNIGWGNLLLDDIVFIDDEIHQTFPNTEIELTDVFLNISGASIGRSACSNIKLVGGNVNQHVCIIRTFRNQLNPIFLNLFLLSKKGQKQIDSFQSGGNRQGLNIGQIKTFFIPLPPIAEQTAIAAALSDMDALIALTEQLIQKKKDIKQGLMQQLLKPKEGWEIKRLEDVCEIKKGEQLNRNILTTKGNYPVYNGGINPSGFTNEFNTYENSIIISEGGNSCGFVNFIEKKFWRGGHCYHITPNLLLENKFLFYTLKNKELNIMALRVGSGLPNIQKNRLKHFKIFIPSIEEQTRIAQILTDADHEITALEKQLKKLRHQKEGMMQVLLTGRIRFKID